MSSTGVPHIISQDGGNVGCSVKRWFFFQIERIWKFDNVFDTIRFAMLSECSLLYNALSEIGR